MRIKVISDSTCDLSPELIREYDIDIIPLIVMKEGEEFIDGVTITPKDIFEHVANGGNLCSTAARSVVVFQEAFAKYASDYDGVIHINIGAEFSSSYQNACIAAEDFDNVLVIDSRNLATGQGHIVMKAVELGRTENSLAEIKTKLEEYASRVESSFILDRLDYMVKGGRCSSAAALGANLLNLKPCIEVKNGKMTVVKKYRGNMEKVIANYIKDRLAGRTDIDEERIFLSHSTVSAECISVMEEAIAQYGNFNHVYDTTVGCTISCHCGPGTAGILFVRK